MASAIPPDYTFPVDLPADIAARFRAAEKDAIAPVIDAAYAQLDYPNEGVPPSSESLTAAQRALAITILDCSLWSNGNRSRLPGHKDQRRWLGLEPPGPLEEWVDFSLDGVARREPLWRAIKLMEVHDNNGIGPTARAFIGALSSLQRCELWGACNLTFPAPWGLQADVFFPVQVYSEEAKLVGSDAGAWAARFLDQLLEARKEQRNVGSTLLPFLAAVRAEIPLEPRWDALLPISGGYALVDECVLAIPAERRVSAVLTWLSAMRFPVNALKAAIRILPSFPDPAIVEHALRSIPDAGGSQRMHLKALREAAGNHAPLLALIADAEAAAGPPKILTVLAVRTPSAVEELSTEDQTQLLAAGKRYHGKAMSLATLMSDRADDEEESLRFGLTHVAVGDAKGKHVYDAWLYRVDSGVVFAKGKTRVVAERIQFSFESKDEKLAEGLETVLRGPLTVTSLSDEPEAKKPAAKKPAAKKPGRKS